MSRAKLTNIEIEFEICGPMDAETIILIRGLGTQMTEWPDSLINGFLNAGLRVLTFDNRDSGLSGQCEDEYSLIDMAIDVDRLMSHCQVSKAHIFGISMGGIVGQFLAADKPERVISLTSVMSTTGSPDLPHPEPEVLSLMMESAQSTEEAIDLAVRKRLAFQGSKYVESRESATRTVKQLNSRSYTPEGTARQMLAANQCAGDLSRFERIACPSLVIHGESDPLIPIEHGRDTSQRIQGSIFKSIEGMGHTIPAEFGSVIVDTWLEAFRKHEH